MEEKERLISDIPVIIISSEDSANYIRKAYEMGVFLIILTVPFDANIVYQVSNTVKLYAKTKKIDGNQIYKSLGHYLQSRSYELNYAVKEA